MRLTPNPGTNMLGRSGFLIHGGNYLVMISSNGCIVLPPNVRNEIGSSGGQHIGRGAMRSSRMAVLVLFVLVFGGISFADEKASIVRSGETAVRATVSNRTVQASIKTQMKTIKVYESETDAT